MRIMLGRTSYQTLIVLLMSLLVTSAFAETKKECPVLERLGALTDKMGPLQTKILATRVCSSEYFSLLDEKIILSQEFVEISRIAMSFEGCGTLPAKVCS
jgi:hypothetical protein